MEDIMKEELNQDPYHIDLMRTLWENTYRGTVFDYKEQYVATIRLILSIPLDRSEVPENAPEVNPSVIVLIEDTILSPLEVVEFEQIMSKIITKKYQVNIFNQTVLCTFTQALLMVQKQQIEM